MKTFIYGCKIERDRNDFVLDVAKHTVMVIIPFRKLAEIFVNFFELLNKRARDVVRSTATFTCKFINVKMRRYLCTQLVIIPFRYVFIDFVENQSVILNDV